MGSPSNFKKTRSKKNNGKREIMGYSFNLLKKQQEVKEGYAFLCPRCGQHHELFDGSQYVPGQKEGNVLVYACLDKIRIGALAGRLVIHLDDNLTLNYRMISCLLDFVENLTPIAMMATQQDRNIREKSLILRGDEVIKIRFPLTVARSIRYAVQKATQILREQNFLDVDEEKQKKMFDPNCFDEMLCQIAPPPLVSPSSEVLSQLKK